MLKLKISKQKKNSLKYYVFLSLLFVVSLTTISLISNYIRKAGLFEPTPTPIYLKTFQSKTQNVKLSYPSNWSVEDSSSGNCGQPKLDGSACRDRFDFVSPDGVRVRYLMHSESGKALDKIDCGIQSECLEEDILDVETFGIPTLGDVYLVKKYKNAFLHQPRTKDTVPIIGKTQYDGYMINYSLPAKDGYYVFLITTSIRGNEPWQFTYMTSETFYELESVKQAIDILKSIEIY